MGCAPSEDPGNSVFLWALSSFDALQAGVPLFAAQALFSPAQAPSSRIKKALARLRRPHFAPWAKGQGGSQMKTLILTLFSGTIALPFIFISFVALAISKRRRRTHDRPSQSNAPVRRFTKPNPAMARRRPRPFSGSTHRKEVTVYQVYVVCSDSQEQGIDHGRWIDIAQSPNEIQRDIDAMMDASPIQGTHWHIQDYKAPIPITGLESLEKLSSLGLLLKSADERVVIAAYALTENTDCLHLQVAQFVGTEHRFIDYVKGHWRSKYDIPKDVFPYIRWEQVMQDCGFQHVDYQSRCYIFKD